MTLGAFDIQGRTATRSLRAAGLTLLLATLAACGGGGSGGGGTGGGDPGGDPGSDPTPTGTVGVTIGDAPADNFDQILLRVSQITLLADEGEDDFVVSDEAIEIDLLALEATTELVGSSAAVPAGEYCKIRLAVDAIDLVLLDSSGGVEVSEQVVVPANGRIDLNPRGCFELEDAGTLLVQIDLDARNSFAFVDTGSGDVRFRPVAFVDVFDGDGNDVVDGDDGDGGDGAPAGRPERLSFRAGTLRLLTGEAGDDAFDLCGVRPLNGDRPNVDAENCERVTLSDDTAFFDRAAAPTQFGALTDGDELVVGGRLEPDPEGGFLFAALLVDVGPRDGFVRRSGEIFEPIEDGVFFLGDDDRLLSLRPPEIIGEGPGATDGVDLLFVDDVLEVTLADGALVFGEGGEILDESALGFGAEVRVMGLGQPSEDEDDDGALAGILATAVAVEEEDDDGEEFGGEDAELEGIVQETGGGGDAPVQFTVLPEDDDALATVCVLADADTEVVVFSEDDDSAESTPGSVADVVVGTEIEVRGDAEQNDCLVAETIIVELTESDDEADTPEAT